MRSRIHFISESSWSRLETDDFSSVTRMRMQVQGAHPRMRHVADLDSQMQYLAARPVSCGGANPPKFPHLEMKELSSRGRLSLVCIAVPWGERGSGRKERVRDCEGREIIWNCDVAGHPHSAQVPGVREPYRGRPTWRSVDHDLDYGSDCWWWDLYRISP